jgi:hypothetical protein
MGSDSARDEYYIQVRATYKIQFGFVAPFRLHQYAIELLLTIPKLFCVNDDSETR